MLGGSGPASFASYTKTPKKRCPENGHLTEHISPDPPILMKQSKKNFLSLTGDEHWFNCNTYIDRDCVSLGSSHELQEPLFKQLISRCGIAPPHMIQGRFRVTEANRAREGDCHSAGVWWLSVLLQCRCDANTSPLSLSVASSSSSFPLYFPSSMFAFLIFSTAPSLCPLSPIFLLSPPRCIPLLFSLNPLSRDEWVEWSAGPWRLLCHPLFRWVQTVCMYVCVCACVCMYLYIYVKYI